MSKRGLVRTVLIFIFAGFVRPTLCQLYTIDQIPATLKEGADAVYMLDSAVYEIVDEEKAIYKLKKVIAILNKSASTEAVFYLHYDPLRVIKKLETKVYGANGELIKKLKSKEYIDQSSISGYSLYEDDRVKIADLRQNSYPYIVSMEYEVERKSTYFIPNWYVLSGEDRSVVKSHYTILSPTGFEPNLKLLNTDAEIIETYDSSKDIKSFTFEMTNIKAMTFEPYGPSLSELVPVLYATPSRFSFKGYQGDFNTWESIGRWQNKLNEGRDELPPETVEEVRSITVGLSTKEEKVKAVYEYMQSKTRYISIQLGIGGFQPFTAMSVDESGYGDCKALSNYTKALLGAIDISSNYTWVYGGDNPMPLMRDFPMDVFNHIILCVPNDKDSIWLECTSQTNPFGYQGTFTGDRDVLMVTPDGAKIVHTTVYTKEDNAQNTFAEVTILDGGDAKASITIEYRGTQYDNYGVDEIASANHEKTKEWIHEYTDVPTFDLKGFHIELKKDKIPSVNESIDIDIHQLASVSGKRMFLAPNLLNKVSFVPKKMEERKTEIALSFVYQDYDSIVYQIPEKYHIEYLPKGVMLSNEIGSYESTFSFENNQLIYVRKMSRNKGRFPKEDYTKFRNFYKSVVKSDKTKVVFVDKT